MVLKSRKQDSLSHMHCDTLVVCFYNSAIPLVKICDTQVFHRKGLNCGLTTKTLQGSQINFHIYAYILCAYAKL